MSGVGGLPRVSFLRMLAEGFLMGVVDPQIETR